MYRGSLKHGGLGKLMERQRLQEISKLGLRRGSWWKVWTWADLVGGSSHDDGPDASKLSHPSKWSQGKALTCPLMDHYVLMIFIHFSSLSKMLLANQTRQERFADFNIPGQHQALCVCFRRWSVPCHPWPAS